MCLDAMALQHLAQMIADRIENGDVDGAVELASGAEKSYLKFAVGESTGAFEVPAEEVEEGDGTMTKTEYVELVRALATVANAGDE